MPLFSQRLGLKPIKVEIQRERADSELRNELWNAIYITYFHNQTSKLIMNLSSSKSILLQKIWIYYFKQAFDELPNYVYEITERIKNEMLRKMWHDLFDILEFIPDNYNEENEKSDESAINKKFYAWANKILERHLSAYRFVNGLLTEITSSEEIDVIEHAVNNIKFLPPVLHLRRALELFSDRSNPDYRNSIKESISAIESFCKTITEDSKATLGKALAVIEKKHELHASLKSAFNALYGYTSDAQGIRHALMDESELRQEDAKFMLVTCSAFINYLSTKTNND
ncbi:AbiJ-NTD4 domain-containing protein [Mucilaginibacter defluvii]|uniref:HEPN AbiJ-N-terminal domain-containing protein n=1 Tax=Mucilaginibacter defluvii TaxID=1196019 RepID=A0ABP9G6C8_9SPHI